MTTSLSPQDRFEIQDLVCRFQQAFDDHDWPLMRRCLTTVLYTDYSSFRAVAPGNIEADRYVKQREAALSHLALQHNFLNLRVEGDAAKATGRCNYLIHRFHPDHTKDLPMFFHSYGHYLFGFERTAGEWRINSITQNLLKNWGDPELHGATRTVNNTKNV